MQKVEEEECQPARKNNYNNTCKMATNAAAVTEEKQYVNKLLNWGEKKHLTNADLKKHTVT